MEQVLQRGYILKQMTKKKAHISVSRFLFGVIRHLPKVSCPARYRRAYAAVMVYLRPIWGARAAHSKDRRGPRGFPPNAFSPLQAGNAEGEVLCHAFPRLFRAA